MFLLRHYTPVNYDCCDKNHSQILNLIFNTTSCLLLLLSFELSNRLPLKNGAPRGAVLAHVTSPKLVFKTKANARAARGAITCLL